MRKIRTIVISIMGFVSPFYMAAQTVELEQVVVTGTRTPKLLKDTPIQTRLVTAKDIAKSDATNIQDLLQTELPGVEFSYAMNQQVNMNLSGFAGQSVLFLVDGERLAGETMDNVDFTRLSMSNIERIEIVKGSYSALYGSSATGGVINIITKSPSKTAPWNLHVDGRLSEHNGQRYNLNFGFRNGILGNTLSVSRTEQDNYSVSNKDGNALTSTFTQVFGDKTWNFRDQISLDLSSKFRLSGRLGYFFRSVSRTELAPERYRDYSAGLKGVWTITDKDNLEVSYSFDQYDKSDFYKLTNKDIRKYSNVQNNTRVIYTHNFLTENGHEGVLTLGGDYMYDFLMNTNLDDSHHQKTFDLFGQYDWRLNNQWELVGALRYDNISDPSSRELNSGQEIHSRLTPKISACWRPTRRLSLRASYGMGFRAPTLKEKYYNFDMASIWIVEGNPDLKAETSHNFNVSADYTKGAYNFTVAGYYNKVNNRITTGIPFHKPGDDSQLYLDYINLGKMNVYNVEATAQARWHNGIGAKLSYVFSHEDLADKTANQYMPARKHSLTLRVDYDRQVTKDFGFNVALTGRAVSSIENTEYRNVYDISQGTTTVTYPAYSLWKLQSSFRILSWIKVNAAIDNLLNYKPDYYYYNAPLTTGINFLVGASIDI